MKSLKRGILLIIVLAVFVICHSIFVYAQADPVDKKLTQDEMMLCNDMSTLMGEIQRFRLDYKTEEWDFLYKHGIMFHDRDQDKLQNAIRMTYRMYLDDTHSAVVYRDSLTKCNRFMYNQKPGVQFQL